MGPDKVLEKGLYPSEATPRFYCVRQTGEETCELADGSAGGVVTGVAQQALDATDVANGRSMNVRVLGSSYAIAGGALSIGDKVRADASGKVVALAAATANQNVVGVVTSKGGVTTVADGDRVVVLLTPGMTAST